MEHSQEKSLVNIVFCKGSEIPKNYANLVRSRWIRSYKRDNDFMKMIHPPSYYAAYNKYVNSVLNRPETTVRLAVLMHDEDVVFGFSVIEPGVLHYVHVPRLYRKQGIGRMLVPDDIQWVTHITKTGLILWPKIKAKFDPFR